MADSEDRVDRYARGELTAVEARALAQKSLDDPDLFEDLTYSAVAKKALSENRFPRKIRPIIPATIAAIFVAAVSIYALRSSIRHTPAPPSIQALSEPPYNIGNPILLGSNFGHFPRPVFRGADSTGRAARTEGTVVAINDGVATIDLGSIDGLEKGVELELYRDSQATTPIARLTVDTVFRDRARGKIVGASHVPLKSEVRVPPTVHLTVLLEHVDALLSQQDVSTAKTMAEQAVAWTESNTVPTADRSKALEKLAAIEYQTASFTEAEKHYGLIVPSDSLIYAESRNNLGALAEKRHDRDAAQTYYAEALRTFERIPGAPAKEREAVEQNLARFDVKQKGK
jgi:tetratricopeptide (TPR) repeat protein